MNMTMRTYTETSHWIVSHVADDTIAECVDRVLRFDWYSC